MAYTINFTDQANNGSITIEDGIINSETDLNLPGRNATGYGSAISENFLHLLENFNSGTEPSRPVEGQLWYDSNENVLKVYNGTNWVASGGLKRATAAPDTGTAILGDLWVDTDNQQLYLFSGSNWVLVGPSFSEGLSTGPQPVELVGQDDVTYTTLQIQVNSQIIAIISKDTFTPKATIAGFQERTIQPGINLSNTTKFYGTAEKAETLTVAGLGDVGGSISVNPSTLAIRTSVDETINGQNITAGSIKANFFVGVGTQAQYADLAEKYTTDKEYPVGTAMCVGGEAEATACKSSCMAIGVISAEPAYLMNSEADGQAIGLKGRVPVRVKGAVSKGQPVYAWEDGVCGTVATTALVGIALESSDSEEEKLIECVLKV